MDSQQLIQALHEAQRQAGSQPCRVVISSMIASHKTPPRGITVAYDPAPKAAAIGEHHKPTITILSIQ